ncbi:MAG: helix-hairpin-helix domain-containing protein [archaeon]
MTNKTNKEISDIFFEIADILEIEKVDWKPQAYRKAARTIRDMKEDIKEIYKREGTKGLDNIPGVGSGICKKIIEYIETGKIKEYERLKKGIPKGLDELMNIRSLGPRKVDYLNKKLNIKNLDDLKKALKEHRLRNLYGFGEKTENNLIQELNLPKKTVKRFPYKKAFKEANFILNKLKKSKEVQRIDIGGSLRRKEETIGDIDIIVASEKPEIVIEKFTSLKNVKRIISKGNKKAIVILKNNMQADIRIFNINGYGAALQYITGNKIHNIRMREIARKKGLKLNEYGLFNLKTGKMLKSNDEDSIYKELGFDKAPLPEERKK